MRLKTKFQDEDFDLGEVVEGVIVECLGKHEEELRVIATAAKGGQHTFYYSSIKKFMDDWEDVPEEPKEYWYIDWNGEVCRSDIHDERTEQMKLIGNYFDSREEAEKAVEKLKAMAKLKEFGFRFIDWELDMKTIADGKIWFDIGVNTEWDAERLLELKPEVKESLDILFGGEE